MENDDYGAFVRRIVATHGRRIAAGDVECLRDLVALAGDVECLRDLVALAGDVERATDAAIAGLRRAGYSWAEIASRLGITRQAAQQRWRDGAVAGASTLYPPTDFVVAPR